MRATPLQSSPLGAGPPPGCRTNRRTPLGSLLTFRYRCDCRSALHILHRERVFLLRDALNVLVRARASIGKSQMEPVDQR
jgi:hypothetical protein